MARQDTTDFLAAFAVGTVLGIGATLLLRPAPRSAKDRLMRELKPHRRKVRKGYGKMRRGPRQGASAAREMGIDAVTVGRELLAEFREEVRRIVEEAREELREASAERPRARRRRPPRDDGAGGEQ